MTILPSSQEKAKIGDFFFFLYSFSAPNSGSHPGLLRPHAGLHTSPRRRSDAAGARPVGTGKGGLDSLLGETWLNVGDASWVPILDGGSTQPPAPRPFLGLESLYHPRRSRPPK